MKVKRIHIVTAVISNDEGEILLVRKRGSAVFIQPGGKREPHEDSVATLVREVREELGVELDMSTACRLGEFEDDAVNEPGCRVLAETFLVELSGSPTPQAEVEEMIWVLPHPPYAVIVAPLTSSRIFPALMNAQGVR